MVESIKELREICQKGIPHNYWKEHTRKISIYLTKLFLYTPITGNQVTLIWILIGIVIGILFSFGNYWYSVIGVLLFPLYAILDCVDGEIARYRGATSLRGNYLDRLGHDIVFPSIFVGITFGVYMNFHRISVFVFGFSTTIFFLLKWLVYLERVNILYNARIKPEIRTNSSKQTKDKIGLLERVGGKITAPTNLYMILWVILIGTILNYLHLVLIFYGVLMPCSWLLNVYLAFRYKFSGV